MSKSISIFHASLGENARQVRLAADRDGEAYWTGLIGEVDDMFWRAVYTGFEYFLREAGYTRTGSHRVGSHCGPHGVKSPHVHNIVIASPVQVSVGSSVPACSFTWARSRTRVSRSIPVKPAPLIPIVFVVSPPLLHDEGTRWAARAPTVGGSVDSAVPVLRPLLAG
jgi:hypothetical protein